MTPRFFPERSVPKSGFQLDCPQLAQATSLPDTYRLLSVFSGVPIPPLDALRRAGLASIDAETGQGQFSLHAHATMRILVDRGLIRWVNWSRQLEGDQPVPSGYVLTGHGELTLTGYFNLYGPAWPGRA